MTCRQLPEQRHRQSRQPLPLLLTCWATCLAWMLLHLQPPRLHPNMQVWSVPCIILCRLLDVHLVCLCVRQPACFPASLLLGCATSVQAWVYLLALGALCRWVCQPQYVLLCPPVREVLAYLTFCLSMAA